ncbi:MAG: endonuclease/exonuclease/phosphatase family protein [Eubacterium sp.]|nr:endonuclease/exonuclease/phosphatase family protein [Eubacterium sp.]
MKKAIKWICISLVTLILVAGIAVGAEVFWYYPHSVQNKRELVAAEQNDDEIIVMSCNLRCITPLDPGKKSWFYRADLIVNNIEKENPGIIGFQEATKIQYKYMCDTLVGYDSVIEFRDKSIISEGCPIFYRTDLYELIDKGSFWLSETPDVMSKDWDSACYRVCSYVILKENASGKEFVVFNTHLDHVSDEARINGIGVVLDKIEQFGSLPSMIMGDFNAAEGSQTYISATENFLDAKYQTENTMESCTYEGYGESLGGKAIDHLMISKTGFEVNSYKVVTDTYDGVYPSDHFQLSVNLTLS